MRRTYAQLCPLPLVLALQAALCSTAWAAPPPTSFDIGAGTTSNIVQTTGSNATVPTNTGSVEGTLSLDSTVGSGVAAITVTSSNAGTVTINNSGTIENTAGGDSSRAIWSKSNTNMVKINNAASGVISSVGDDTIKIGKSGAQFVIDNQGTIWQKGTDPLTAGQAIDVSDADVAGNMLINGSATNSAALIRADGADAINAGTNMTIVNYGTIITNGTVNTKCRDIVAGACDDANAPSAADGIDVGGSTGVVINNHGIISGSRHAITADTEVTVTNYAGGQIIGRNGSGVGSDGVGTVENFGLISGRYAGAGNVYDHTQGGTLPGISPSINDGDGDGVDIDGIGTVTNHGRIEGLGGGGFDSSGNPNSGDGIAMGGGTIVNDAGASIFGQSNGILIDDGANGTATGQPTLGRGTATTPGGVISITNNGSITGNTSVAIGLVGQYADVVTNGITGVITGGANTVRVDQLSSTTPAAAIQMGGGNDTLENSGRIQGLNGKAIDMGDDDDTLRLHAGSVVIGTIDGGTGTNLLETDGTQNFTAGQIGNFQNFTIKGGNTTFDTLGTVGSVQVDAGGSLRVNGAFGTTGDMTVNGTLQAAAGDSFRTVNIAGNYTQSATGVLETRIGVLGGDKLSVAQTATLSDGATIRPMLTSYVVDGATFDIVDAGTLDATAANLKIDSTSNFLTYTLEQTSNGLTLVAHRTQSLISMVPQNSGGFSSGLQQLFDNGSQGSINLLNALESLPNAAAVNSATQQLAPETNQAVQSASAAAQGSVFSAFDNRMDAARDGGSLTMLNGSGSGIATGETVGKRFWVQGLVAVAQQKARKGANGFDLNAGGMAFGFESDLNARDMAGVSGGYTQAGSDGRDAGDGDDSDVKSYHLGGYFSRTEENYTLDASLVASLNHYSSSRRVAIPGFTEDLNGSYSGYQIGTRVEYGIPFKLNNAWNGRWLVGARLSHLDNDGYTESGGVTAQRIGDSSSNSTQSVLGVEFVDKLSASSSANLRARYLHEFSNTASIDATFVNGGPSFTLNGVQPGRDALELGVGYRQVTAQGTVISIGYDLELRDEYIGHQLSAKAMWSF
ncbi:MAG TPA: autotransporter domain-containing protein [Herbaspirillum sp.]